MLFFTKHIGLCDEIAYSKRLLQNISDPVIRDRVQNILLWNIKKAVSCRQWYYLCVITSLALGAAIPVISLLSENAMKSMAISILSSLNTASLSISSIFVFKDNWRRYRQYAELIKSECIKYVKKVGIYSNNDIDVDEEFLARIESLNNLENLEWIDTRKQQTDQASRQ